MLPSGGTGAGDGSGPGPGTGVGPPTALLVVFVIGFCDSKVLMSLSGFSGFLLNIRTISECSGAGAFPFYGEAIAISMALRGHKG
jgi:hypothetical protein